jgi:hypothetical protein
MRIKAEAPFGVVASPGMTAFDAFQSGMRTLAEALSLSASRRLDLDPSEFTSGYRIIPTNSADTLIGEIYLFDTLAGGAGYSNQIGEELADVLQNDVRKLLTECNCERSCYDCLQHYGNQFYHSGLDRYLGLALLDYALEGKLPPIKDTKAQVGLLRPLARLLELSGVSVALEQAHGQTTVPLIIRGPKKTVVVGTIHGFLDRGGGESIHPLSQLANAEVEIYLANEFLLSRNLPSVYQTLVELVGGTSEVVEDSGPTAPVRSIPDKARFELEDAPRGMPNDCDPKFKRLKLDGEPSLRKVYLVRAPSGEYVAVRIQRLRRTDGEVVYRCQPANPRDVVEPFNTRLEDVVAELAI